MYKNLALLFLLGIFSASAFGQENFEKEWKQVQGFSDQGLPQSALKIVDSIYAVTKADGNSVQFLKTSLYQMKLHSDYQEEYMESSIRQVKLEASTAQEPMKQALHSILAELYWRYYEGNRFKFLDRTTTTTADPEDITTWDLRTLSEAATSSYEASLENPGALQKIALDPFDPILETVSGSKSYRPTLFDFLAHRGLDFFMNTETSLTKPADRFELDKPDYFLPAPDFARLTLATTDGTSLSFRALQVLQSLLVFHLADADPTAFIDADLKRLDFVWNNSVLPNRQELYLGALKNLSDKYSGHPASTDVLYDMATVYSIRGAGYDPFNAAQYRWDLKQAKEICEEAINRFPSTNGAANCQVLLGQLTGEELQLTMHYASQPTRSFLAGLTYKNTEKVYFRVIKLDPEENRNIRQKNREEAIIQQYLKFPAVTSWEESLPDDGDLQSHRVQLRFPALQKGFYIILASSGADFIPGERSIAYASFWTTSISYISNRGSESNTEFFVLDRENGTPLPGVTAKTFVREYDYSTRTYNMKEQSTYTTDGQGYFSIPLSNENARSFYVKFSKGDDIFYTESYFYQYPGEPETKPRDVTYFFADRAIYRPGQTIYFKGVLLENKGKEYTIKPGAKTVVGFYDVNDQKVAELQLTTNEYGSFNGAFSAPAVVLTGSMQIRNESGRLPVSVEEYKRPKFEVKVDPLEGNYRLNEIVHVTGEAKAYAGNAIDGAKVDFRVVRRAEFPFWRSWWNFWPESEEMEITNGTTTTDENGKYAIEFKAIPDLGLDPSNEPVFHFTIYIDVTDINGESHSAEQSVSVARKSLYISANIPEKLNISGENRFKISAGNLNGQPLDAVGSINIYPLEQPGKVLRKRDWTRPDVFVMDEKAFNKEFPNEIYDDEDDPATWAKGNVVYSIPFDTGKDSIISLSDLSSWQPGSYLVEIKSMDAFGEEVIVKDYITVFSPASGNFPQSHPDWSVLLKPVAEPGETVSFLFGSAEKDARVLYEVLNKDQLIKRQWFMVSHEQIKIELPVAEEYRGNFTVRFTLVKGNRSYSEQLLIRVPFTNKELDMRMETFRDKLIPGQQEEWRIRITGKQGDKVSAELLAAMYDASLDAFAINHWALNLYGYSGSGPSWNVNDAFFTTLANVYTKIHPYEIPFTRTYDQLNWFGFNYNGGGYRPYMYKSMDRTLAPGMANTLAEESVPITADKGVEMYEVVESSPATPASVPEIPEVPVRRNFEETAFFFPELHTDANGDILIKFKVPESLTAWKFMGLAYTRDLKTGYLEEQAVTQKKLMVVPNPPRFFREGDKISFTAKIVSMHDKDLRGTVTAEFFDALTMNPVNDLLGNSVAPKSFMIDKGKSTAISWDITIPQGLEAVVYRIVAVADDFSDGEEAVVPVLPNRMLVTETLPLPISGKGTKSFTMSKLVNSGSSSSIKDYKLTLEFTSNPAWYAVQALPYLMEADEDCADALFTKVYANSLASWIANSSPKIKQVFDGWKNLSPDALRSNLEKNEELKSVLLQETPWVLQARSESEQKQRIALLFDFNSLAGEQAMAITKLAQMQTPNGGWPWFEGMKDSPYITQNIITGFGKLWHLGVIDLQARPEVLSMVSRGIAYMDQRIKEDYDDMVNRDKDKMGEDHLSALHIQYLYGRSYFLEIFPLEERYEEAFGYYKGQASRYWTSRNKYIQGMIALALNRLDDKDTPPRIIKSLKENSLSSEEMGMYWRDNAGYFWHELPVERQALLIETFSEVTNDQESVRKMQVWLLKQKQTQMWSTSKATADAVYALLLQGTDLLASSQLVEVTLGSEKVDPFRTDGVSVEAGTGYFQTSWAGESVKPSMGKIKVVKEDDGIAWGAVYWQYFEDLDRITPAKTPLALEKKLFCQDNTPTGPVLTPVVATTVLKTGDKVVVRIVLKVDRDMEFVHMKDMRAAAFEPVNVMSGYRYQGGLGYYEATCDASMNFYFDYLRKGSYVFEYTLTVTQTGEFSNGITTIQCQYAPEFSAHSEGIRVVVE